MWEALCGVMYAETVECELFGMYSLALGIVLIEFGSSYGGASFPCVGLVYYAKYNNVNCTFRFVSHPLETAVYLSRGAYSVHSCQNVVCNESIPTMAILGFDRRRSVMGMYSWLMHFSYDTRLMDGLIAFK